MAKGRRSAVSIHELTETEEKRAGRIMAQLASAEERRRACIAKRDAEVCRLVRKGALMRKVGEHFGLTQQGVGKICKAADTAES